MNEDLKIKHSVEIIAETDEEVLIRVSWNIMGEYFEHWYTEKKEEHP